MQQFIADNVSLFLALMAFGALVMAARMRRARNKPAGPPATLRTLEGTYRGFGPTDESPIGRGEMRIVFKGDVAKIRFAGGLYIVEEKIPLMDFRRMTDGELRAHFNEGHILDGATVGFRSETQQYPQLLFMSNATGTKWKCDMLVVRTGGLGEVLGPTVLFSPRFIPRCKFVISMIVMQIMARGRMPWLIFGGEVRRYDEAV